MAVFQSAPATSRFTPVATIPVPGSASPAPATPYTGVFIPEIWSNKLVDKYYDATVLAQIANTDYEGEIQSYGDTIHIRQRPDVTIKDYQPDQALEIERPSAPLISLNIDQAHYFNVAVDDIWRHQSDLDMMNMWATEASEQMKLRTDTNVLASLPTVAATGNFGANAGVDSGNINLGVTTSPVELVARNAGAGETEIIDFIIDMGQVLDEQNVPETGRFLIVPTFVSSMLKKSELRDASVTGDGTSPMRNGRLGEIDRFTLYTSNRLPNPGAAGEHYMFAGTKAANTFAAQMTEMEEIRLQSTFGTSLRGLFVYGFGAIKGEALAVGVVAKA